MTSLQGLAAFEGLAFVTGLCTGSFANVCIARMPHDLSVVSPRSACPACGHPVRARDNIPIVSWLLLKARCRDCKTAISIRYPAIEGGMGLLSLLWFRHVIPDPGSITVAALATWATYLVFLTMLVATTFIDLRHYIIPDEFSIWAIPMGLVGVVILGALGQPGVPSWQESLIGAVVGGGSLLLIMGAYWLIRREEGMGLGDVKLLAMFGAWLGPLPALPVIILLSSILGSVIGIGLMLGQDKGMKSQIPFGPFLAIGAIGYLFFWEEHLVRLLPSLAF